MTERRPSDTPPEDRPSNDPASKDRGASDRSGTATTNQTITGQATSGTGDVGWMPAIMALLLIGLVAILLVCGVGTWFVFSRSPQLAAGSLKAQYVPAVEQSMLEPEHKQAVLQQLERVIAELEKEQIDPAAARDLMQRLIRAPIVQWGDLDALLTQIGQRETFTEEERTNASRLINRLKHGAEEEQITANDFEDALQPVLAPDDSIRGNHFHLGSSDEAIREVLHRIGLLVDREQIPDKSYETAVEDVVRLQIEKAKESSQ